MKGLSVFILLLCVVPIVGENSIRIVVDRLEGEMLYGRIECPQSTRIYVYYHDHPDLSIQQAEQRATFVYSVVPNGIFQLSAEHDKIQKQPFVAILARSTVDHHTGYLNYKIPTQVLECNAFALSIDKLVDLKDSCVEITVLYEGEGEIYYLQREVGIDVPRAANVVAEGVYLGRLSHSSVQTMSCNFRANMEYTIYVTAVSASCVHSVVSQTIHISSLRTATMIDNRLMGLWEHGVPSSLQHVGVKYRRYGGNIGYPSFFDQIHISTTGVLLDSLQQVKHVVAEHSHIQPEKTFPLEHFSITWKEAEKKGSTFVGILSVVGEGEVYIFHASQTAKVTLQDVISYGQNIGYFERENLHISLVEPEPLHRYYATLVFGGQFYGPAIVSV